MISRKLSHITRSRATTAAIACALLIIGATSTAWSQEGGALPAKREGIVRIGLVKPKVQMGSGEAPQAADSVRNILAEYLQGPTIEIALLSARLPSQYAVEAAQAECDFVLSSVLTHRRGGDAAAFGKILGSVANYAPYIPGGGYAQSAVVSGVLHTAADFATNIKAKDEMRLDYRLDAVGAQKPLLESSAKDRAKTDGEDLLTPLVEGAAEAIGAAVTKQ